MVKKQQIAIVGLGGVFPSARDIDHYWNNIINARDLTREPPPGRWLLSMEDVYNGSGPLPDRVYSRRACFVDNFKLNRDGLQLDDKLIDSLDPMFQLLLEAGNQAWLDGITTHVDKNRAGIIIGNIALPTHASSALAEELIGPVFETRILGHCNRLNNTNRLNRYVAGLPAGLLARALGLTGGSYTLDAACASSLYAVKYAMDELIAGRADAMLAGGLSRPDSLYTQMGFSSLHAISSSGHCSPFDSKADGLVVGEGSGMVLMKRLEDAIADGDRIYAVIRGAGLSNDIGGNIMSPDSEGQLRAMRSAYDQAGWQPDDVDLIECHGTGTPVGDVVEFNSLRTLWGGVTTDRKCVIGSVKSNIGHLLTAAGSAGLIKILLAIRDKTLPPTANYKSANPKIDLGASPFTVLSQQQEWQQRNDQTPRRAAISAFGFGGINAHLLLEEWCTGIQQEKLIPAVSVPGAIEEIAIIGMDTSFGPWQGLSEFTQRVLGGSDGPSPETLNKWWGVKNDNNIKGYAIEKIDIPLGRFRIPPNELKDMLPQQLLMLQVAANAIEDAGLALQQRMVDTGVYIGIGLDLNTTNFHMRWSLLDKAREWLKKLGLTSAETQLNKWVEALRDAFYPALTANRTMGALGGIVASRIARAFNVGGPSFTLSSEEASGLRALEAGVRALQRNEIDTAIVGAVDLASDIRAVCGQDETRPYSRKGIIAPFDTGADGTIVGDGAAAVILKRYTDAKRDNDRIYAIIKGVGGACGARSEGLIPDTENYCRAVEKSVAEAGISTTQIEYVETHGSGHPGEDCMEASAMVNLFRNRQTELPVAIGSVKADVGHTGAASGMASLIKTSLSLYHNIVPPVRNLDQLLPEINSAGNLYAPREKQYWLRNRAEGPRHALVNSFSIDGNCISAVLAGTDANKTNHVADTINTNDSALFSIEGNSQAELLDGLVLLKEKNITGDLHRLACDWFQSGNKQKGSLAVSILASSTQALDGFIQKAMESVRQNHYVADNEIFFNPEPLGPGAGIAFVFPGSGNHFSGMGREAAARWPQLLDRLDRENLCLASQFAGNKFWAENDGATLSHEDVIFGQVWLGTMMSDIISSLGIKPDAVIGYSLGETAGLFATRTWVDRDLMLDRIRNSTLFTEDLAGACKAARQSWGLADTDTVDWKVGVVDCPAETVKQKINGRTQVYLLIVNTGEECVIGGNRAAVEALVRDLGCHFHPIDGVTTVHCEVVKPVAKAYRDLHLFNSTPPPEIKFYSGILGGSYDVTTDSAADSITGQALHYFEYPRVINSAYDEGARIFIEMGPGATCTRMISRILAGRKHMARALCVKGQSEVQNIMRIIAHLNTERVQLDLSTFYAEQQATSYKLQEQQNDKIISVEAGRRAFEIPMPEQQFKVEREKFKGIEEQKDSKKATVVSLTDRQGQGDLMAEIITRMQAAETAKMEAQEAFLRVANGISESLARAISAQTDILKSLPDGGHFTPVVITSESQRQGSGNGRQPLLDRGQCLEFAVGSIAKVLGEAFAEIDHYPTRVRLPDEPLMLADRIMEVEGEPCSMKTGRVITEHDILPGAWYLDCGRIPTCIAVEAGQADLFLSGYLGIDLQTRGLAMYRLLDAEVTFHGALPGAGKIIRYDIHIDHFFRQGNTWLFRFRFDGTVNGKPLITMRNGCAGFFTQAELAAGQGIVQTSLEKRNTRGQLPQDWRYPVPMKKESYSDTQIDALRQSRLEDCFGDAFAGLKLTSPATLPKDRMNLVHRVLNIDPDGGRFGIGIITGEADIHPDDWFLTCHFVDDRVMPGTLMYECCLHTLRIYLLRMGWIGESDKIVYEPVPEITGKLKCRGQVIETTRRVHYEITLKELGYMSSGTPYVIADALMYADGRAIVQMTDMSLMLSGLTREQVDLLWQSRHTVTGKPPIFDHDSILAFAVGNPSDAFGERYRIFDNDRVIARLPGPPYQFLDRIVAIDNCEQWQLKAGGVIEAEYDVPAGAWYFAEDRQPVMPFAVLLETALQPCGWLAAYLGSALTSETDLSFRNLGGRATQYQAVTPATGTLTTRIKITSVSSSGGMVIQHYDFDLYSGDSLIYKGNTYFGFFTRAALANQIGLRDVSPYQASAAEQERGQEYVYPDRPPYPKTMLRMIDEIQLFDPAGGPNGLGFITGTAWVNPDNWFFKAHFYQDPVWPGSLGLESFIQLLKIVACHHWGEDAENTVFEAMAPGLEHAWTYRGQIIPTDQLVTVQAVITALNHNEKILRADGFLTVDGRLIYQMNDFTLKINP